MTLENSRYGLSFISDQRLIEASDKLLSRLQHTKENHNPYKNVIDPFSAVFEAAAMGIPLDEWLPLEVSRQLNKSLSNFIGDFHQELLGQLPGWRSTGASGGVVDLVHETPFGERGTPVLAELKNKFNTLNSGGQENVYDKFQNALAWPNYKGYTCYLIEIIPKNPKLVDVPWSAPNRGKREDIRRIDAATIYAWTTGDKNAFYNLYRALNQILNERYMPRGEQDVAIAKDLFRKAFVR